MSEQTLNARIRSFSTNVALVGTVAYLTYILRGWFAAEVLAWGVLVFGGVLAGRHRTLRRASWIVAGGMTVGLGAVLTVGL